MTRMHACLHGSERNALCVCYVRQHTQNRYPRITVKVQKRYFEQLESERRKQHYVLLGLSCLDNNNNIRGGVLV